MSQVQNNSVKNASKIEATSQVSNVETPNREVIVLTPQVEEIKPQKSILDIAKSVNNLNELLTQHEKFQARLKEIKDFKDLLTDGSGCNLVVTHSSGKNIAFANLESIHHYINDALESGNKAFDNLEQKIKQSTL